jgi:hypothetical protein
MKCMVSNHDLKLFMFVYFYNRIFTLFVFLFVNVRLKMISSILLSALFLSFLFRKRKSCMHWFTVSLVNLFFSSSSSSSFFWILMHSYAYLCYKNTNSRNKLDTSSINCYKSLRDDSDGGCCLDKSNAILCIS